MSHPKIDNSTPYAVEPLYLTDEDGRPLVVPLVQASYDIDARTGLIALCEKQAVFPIGGEFWGDDPATASLRYEMQIAFIKPATDVVLIGHALAPHARATESQAGIRLGPIQKLVRVLGDRRRVKGLAGSSVTAPQPFERIALRYEHAYGGWDRRHPDPLKHRCVPANPVGRGFRDDALPAEDEVLLPNLEDPKDPSAPAAFGFIAPHWMPRAGFAGTYDAAWDAQRKPLLPTDFDRRYFNAASPGLVLPGRLRGDEPVIVIGTTPGGRLETRVPPAAPPVCTAHLKRGGTRPIELALDTVVVDTDDMTISLQWRGHAALRNGPHDLAMLTLERPSA
jgi:hypothetical protein